MHHTTVITFSGIAHRGACFLVTATSAIISTTGCSVRHSHLGGPIKPRKQRLPLEQGLVQSSCSSLLGC
eukprot:6456762-Heterocapsa_arctica.AAC.1